MDRFGVAPDQGQVDLPVLRLDLDPGGRDASSLFINPTGLGEPAAPIQRVSGASTFSELQLMRASYWANTVS